MIDSADAKILANLSDDALWAMFGVEATVSEKDVDRQNLINKILNSNEDVKYKSYIFNVHYFEDTQKWYAYFAGSRGYKTRMSRYKNTYTFESKEKLNRYLNKCIERANKKWEEKEAKKAEMKKLRAEWNC